MTVGIVDSTVIGRDWNFMVLEGTHYTVSRDFSGLTTEIFDILCILKALKATIIDLTEPFLPN